MKQPILLCGLFAVALTAASREAAAGGTPPCTDIVNQATVRYTVSGNTISSSSNPTTTPVAELLDVSVVWQDASSVVVSPGDSSRVLSFLVTNTGNGSESFDLSGITSLLGDDFDPTIVALYLDDGDALFEPLSDALYVPAVNDPTLASDGTVLVFLASDIPLGLAEGDEGDAELLATADTGSGDPGDVFPGDGDCGSDAVVGSSGGDDSDVGTYLGASAVVTIVKSADVTDPWGGSQPVPGAVITYTLTITTTGSGTAVGVTVTDPIPGFTTYFPNSLTLDAGGLSDPADADAGDVGGTTPDVVTVSLGVLTGSSPTHVVTFAVTID